MIELALSTKKLSEIEIIKLKILIVKFDSIKAHEVKVQSLPILYI